MTPIRAGRAAQLARHVEVVNIGLPAFEAALRSQGVPVIGVDWRIPAEGASEVIAALARLWGPKSAVIDAANAEVLSRLEGGSPLLRAVDRAGAVVPGLGDHRLLHCGPALPWEEMCDPLRRSVKAAIIAEGWAPDLEAADTLMTAGGIELRPANEHATVLPMATVLGPSAPVYIVENAGTLAYASLNQGAGEVQWFGVDSPPAIARLRFLRDVVGPVLAEALAGRGPIDVLALAAQGLVMGDDLHMRVQATTNLLLRDLLPFLVRSRHPRAAEAADFLSANHMMFLNVAMAAAKSLVDAAMDVAHSSLVATMARNGTSYGIRIAGAPQRWHLARAPMVGQALYHAGFGPEAAAADIGDSAVLELIGLGGAAAAGSPAVAAFLGGRMADAVAATQRMRLVCAGESRRFRLPVLDNAGTPLGIDVRRVAELSIAPAVNTGIIDAAHGRGQIGAGIAHAPVACFVEAVLDLDARLR